VDVEYRRPDLPAPRPGIFFVYAIQCDDGSFYIGHTDNLERRWEEHRSGTGAEHTKKHRPVELVHFEELKSREAAVKRERDLKTGFGRKWLKREVAAGRARQAGGSIAGDKVWLIDFEDPGNNDWVAVNQFSVQDLPARGAQAGGQYTRRPDIVVFINGLPLEVVELKNPADEEATIWTAFNQLQTYKQQIPSLFAYNEALIVSDGLEARAGSLTANREWFLPWRTIEGDLPVRADKDRTQTGELAPATMLQLEVLVRGVFEKKRFLDLVRHFIAFEVDGSVITKKMAGYHQFHAVNRAVEATVQAAGPKGDKRCGVVWHTQGSGKSLTMAFYAGRIILHPAMENPTLVVLTDRNDLDEQLFSTFAQCHELLRQKPVQAQDRADLRKLLQVASGGVVFTTIQKFFPEEKGDPPARGARAGPPARLRAGRYPLLSDRRNIVVIADEAHRSQYDFIDGFARHMRDALPNASFIGFTGTPIELTDKNTRAVFGDYISIYDIQRAVQDGATVPIYYESRLAKLELKEDEKPHLDAEFEEVTEGEEEARKEKLKTKWAALEAVVGTEKRIGLIARDLVEHFERRLEAIDGKAMVVCMSRRICVELYNAIIKLRPQWHKEDDDKGMIKIVMTGSASDTLEWQPHIRNKPRREALAKRFRDPDDPFKMVIVRDMWLTGFDAPCLHTMYVDKPMRGHGLMQAIARVNRVFRDKPGGLVVDYLGLADQLKRALADYTESGGTGKTAIDQKEAVSVMLEKYEICRDLFHLPAPPPSPFYVYAVECENDSLYIGQTENLTRRWQKHQAGTASEWTLKYRPVRIGHYEPASTREQAMKMEAEWKTGFGRQRLKRLIEKGGARQAGGFDWSLWTTGTPAQRLGLLPPAQEHILAQVDGKTRLLKAVTELSQAFALAVPQAEALRILDDVAFFQAVRSALAKSSGTGTRTEEELDHAIRQLVSKAVSSEKVVDIFAAAGLKKPDISILSDEFLVEVRGLPHRNLAVELLRKLLSDEIKTRSKKNLVQARSFAEMLERSVRAYQNRAIETAQVIEQLIVLAKDIREAHKRGEKLGLTDDELAFYDALEVNDSAVKVLGNETLMTIARELVENVRRNVTIDWTVKDSARAKLRTLVKRILRKYGYPPDKQERATQTVLEQAELLCHEWAA
jgi:type I restriction enzyme R subunit